MNFRTILAFIVIAFVSSLFNKNKTSTKPPVRTDRPTPQGPPPVDKVPGTTESKRRGFSAELEELFKEMRAEFDRTHEGAHEKQAHSPTEEIAKDGNSTKVKRKLHPSKARTVSKKDIKKTIGSVYQGEIGAGEAYIKFNKKSIIQGVVMSEILQKPKGLRR